MKKSTEIERLPDPPTRTIFKQDKDGKYHHTVTKADLCTGVASVRTDRFVTTELIFFQETCK